MFQLLNSEQLITHIQEHGESIQNHDIINDKHQILKKQEDYEPHYLDYLWQKLDYKKNSEWTQQIRYP